MTTITFDSEYEIGETVFLRAGDPDLKGIVTRLSLCAEGAVMYCISWGDRQDRDHFAVELSRQPSYGGVPAIN